MNFREEFNLSIRARCAVLYVTTREEERLLSVVKDCAAELENMRVVSWDFASGFDVGVAVGKGNIPDDKTPKTLTEPADYVMDAVIAGITNPVDGECQVTVQINSANVDKGFYCTAVVLYAISIHALREEGDRLPDP